MVGVIARSTATKQARSVRVAAGFALSLYLSATFAADLPVYDATQVAYNNYTIIKRIWVDDWKTAFWVGGESSVEAARQAVIDRAAKAGADAIVNLTCLSRTDRVVNTAGFYCYADAIKKK